MLTTKVHAGIDALGNPIRIHLIAGNVADITPACDLIAGLKADWTIADKAYDADRFIALAVKQCSQPVIPPGSNRLEQRWFDRCLFKEWHLVECFIIKVKVLRCISTRYDNLAVTFKALVLITACMVWLQ